MRVKGAEPSQGKVSGLASVASSLPSFISVSPPVVAWETSANDPRFLQLTLFPPPHLRCLLSSQLCLARSPARCRLLTSLPGSRPSPLVLERPRRRPHLHPTPRRTYEQHKHIIFPTWSPPRPRTGTLRRARLCLCADGRRWAATARTAPPATEDVNTTTTHTTTSPREEHSICLSNVSTSS